MEATAKELWKSVVARLLKRNGGVDLRQASIHRSVPCKTFRSRLLEADEDSLLVERPNGGQSVRDLIADGNTVYVLLSDQSDRIELGCKVIGPERYELNANVKLPAVRLSLPNEVRSAQRRSHFRVSTAAQKLGPIYMTPVRPPIEYNSKGQPILNKALTLPDPEPFEVKLLNLAAGGLGAEAEEDATTMVKSYKDFCVRLTLPGLDKPVVVNAKLVHLESERRDKMTFFYMGMQFVFADAREQQSVTSQIMQYTSSIEREQLRHIKEKQS